MDLGFSGFSSIDSTLPSSSNSTTPYSLRVGHRVGEDPPAGSGCRLGELPAQADAVEDVVAEDQRDRLVADEVRADQERLGDALRSRLHRVLQPQPELAAVAEQPLELRPGPPGS